MENIVIDDNLTSKAKNKNSSQVSLVSPQMAFIVQIWYTFQA